MTPLRAGTLSEENRNGLNNGLDQLFALLPDKPQQLDITVSDALARCWVVERVAGLANEHEIAQLAESQMQDLYGDAPDTAGHWAVRVDATPFDQHWPATALAKSLIDLIEQAATRHGCRIVRLRTRFAARVNGYAPPMLQAPGKTVFVLDHSDALSIGIRDKSAWLALRTHPPLALLGTELPTMLNRECKPLGINPDECRVERLASEKERNTVLRLDFAPHPAPSSLRLGLGSAMLALILALAWSLNNETVAVPPEHLAALPSLEEVDAINGAIDELNFPWTHVLGIVESIVGDDLRLARFEADARDGKAGLQGEARESRAIFNLPAQLRANPLVADARIVSQAPVSESIGSAYSMRFGLELSLQTPTGERP
jgi:hypothetical protein